MFKFISLAFRFFSTLQIMQTGPRYDHQSYVTCLL